MKIVPSKLQWNKWSLPSKAGYVGACIGLIALVLAVSIPLLQMLITKKDERPLISIASIDSYLNEGSMETKFIIKNMGNQPAFILIKGEAFIDGKLIEVKNQKSESAFQVMMPDQHLKYRGLVIEGRTYRSILSGDLTTRIIQNIKIEYGNSEKTIGEYYTFQSVKLDVAKLVEFKNPLKISDGFWILEKSNSK